MSAITSLDQLPSKERQIDHVHITKRRSSFLVEIAGITCGGCEGLLRGVLP
eukprot:CAMPEP_0184697374 /NCGR_PEP_ID=MMETSP0313-20130426/4356_1 /TAXON_ID=2792 /ORGANISM="Porphyridium aerugineum, Strain SAG 1380-2" /LENGTH=50 /DNA_ID=CAMNT_0027156159 /DNA_START=119 /DNA_END=267 /DNA_ORIENTATION=+